MKRNKKTQSHKLFYRLWVEGECEKLYFQHLQRLINRSDPERSVEFSVSVGESLSSCLKTSVWESEEFLVWDREGTCEQETASFRKTLEELSKKRERNIYPGYTHLTFELWILLHFGEFCAPCSRKEGYLRLLNDHSSQKFESLKEYKQEKNFRKVLEQISLENVKEAVERGKRIREMKTEHGEKPETFGKFQTYGSNPDLLLHQCVEKILRECRPN